MRPGMFSRKTGNEMAAKGSGKKALILAVIALLFSASSAGAYLGVKRFIPLHDILNQGASGEALIEPSESFMPGQRMVGVNVWHLKPNSIYTVWLVNENPRDGAYALGLDTNFFKTDGKGNGRYVTTIHEYTLQYWRFIEVNYHPNGDPNDSKEMVEELKGDMRYGFHT